MIESIEIHDALTFLSILANEEHQQGCIVWTVRESGKFYSVWHLRCLAEADHELIAKSINNFTTSYSLHWHARNPCWGVTPCRGCKLY